MILGIDIGVQGAVAVLDQSGALQEIHDMPTLQDGPAGRRDASLLASIIFASHATAAFVESVSAGQGKALQAPLPLAAPVTSSKAFSPQGDDPGWLRCCAQWRPTPYGMADFSQPARWAWMIMVTFPGKA
jgi:hypothetical protein